MGGGRGRRRRSERTTPAAEGKDKWMEERMKTLIRRRKGKGQKRKKKEETKGGLKESLDTPGGSLMVSMDGWKTNKK